MAAQTGSTYICGTTIDSVEIPLFLFPVVGIIWGTLSLNSPWSKTLDWLLESNVFVVLILKSLGAFYPQAHQVCVKIESQYEG